MSDSAFAEVEAMRKVAEALQGLDTDAVARVLRWANSAIGSAAPLQNLTDTAAPHKRDNLQDGPSEAGFKDIAELFQATKPNSGADRAMVAAYWFQNVLGESEFDAQRVNTELKHMGYRSANITMALGSLINQTPQLVIQTRKDGSTKQARKRYRLTKAGMARVEEMVAQYA